MNHKLTEQWLGSMGGWQALKTARALVNGGAVLSVASANGWLSGQVKDGGKSFACRLTLPEIKETTGECTCPMGRRGLICPHMLALGLAQITPQPSRPSAPAAAATVSSPNESPKCEVPQGPPLERGWRILFPKNLEEAWRRGRFTLSLLPGEIPSPADERLADWLHRAGAGDHPRMVEIPCPDGPGEILPLLSGHPALQYGGNGSLLSLSPGAWRPLLLGKKEGNEITLHPADEWESGSLLPGGWWWDGQELVQLAQASKPMEGFWQQPWKPEGWCLEEREFVKNRALLEEWYQIDPEEGATPLPESQPGRFRTKLALEGSWRRLEAILSFQYPGVVQAEGAADSAAFPVLAPDQAGHYLTRNRSSEDREIDFLREWGFQKSAGPWILEGTREVASFLSSAWGDVSRRWDITPGPRLETILEDVERIRPALDFEETTDQRTSSPSRGWLECGFSYRSDKGTSLTRDEVLRLLRSGQESVVKNGRRLLIDRSSIEDFEEALAASDSRQQAGRILINPLQADWLKRTSGQPEAGLLAPEHELETHVGPLAEVLRDYQKAGVRWLAARALQQWGGVLADDMGLGKTIQMLAAFRWIAKEAGAGPCLVVCPRSLLANWEEEASRFLPDWPVRLWHGPKRHAEPLPHSGIVCTTYSLLQADEKLLQTHPWLVIALDEASMIRNPDTAAAAAARSLPARFGKFALTGTPMENRLEDWWSIMEFALPGSLGTRKDFQERYVKPVASGTPVEKRSALGRLRQRLEPWSLRRTKSAVLTELPPKTIQIQWCEPTPAQAGFYARLTHEIRDSLQQGQKNLTSGGLRARMFTALLRLRQACCDLRLLQADHPAEEASGKWEPLAEWIRQLEESGEKYLIFSQFTSFLKLARAFLTEKGVNHAYLDGSTIDRAGAVKQFQEDKSCQAFLISLKAGGYGLNLTAARHVFLLDPWWNPAVEAQAIDRAHRMGQSGNVQAVRFLTKGTVEEKIHKLQEEKRHLIRCTVDDETPLMEGLTDNDLEQLLF